MKAIPISMAEVAERTTLNVEVHITGIRRFRVRLWIGSRVMKLGAWIIGYGLEWKVTHE